MTSKTKQIIIAVVIIVVAFVGYQMFFVKDNSGGQAIAPDGVNKAPFIDGQAILVLLGKLKEVSLNEDVFSDKVFVSLQSFERPIESQVMGRKNPFATIGTEGSGVVITTSSSTPRLR